MSDQPRSSAGTIPDATPFRQWVGRQQTTTDTLRPFPAMALAAALDRNDRPGNGEELPPLWHWIYFLELVRHGELAENGHARLGDFLPPVPLPRRMFAGARVTFHAPLLIGNEARRVSTIADVRRKQGRSGEMIFVLVRNEIAGPGGMAIVEEQDIVYRNAPLETEPAPTSRRAPAKPVWTRAFETDETLLFRYSALIFSAHRIHFDLPYALQEGYAGLVVHGQLIATLLADLVRRNTDAAMHSFRFRSVCPLINRATGMLCGIPAGNTVDLWAEDASGQVVMEAQAQLSKR